MAAGCFIPPNPSRDHALSAKEVRRALCELPGWKAFRYSRRLRGQWHVTTAGDAAGLLIVVEAAAFAHQLFPVVHCTGRSLTIILSDPHTSAVTPAVLAYAKRLSGLVGLPSASPLPAPPVVAAVVRELISRQFEDGVLHAERSRQETREGTTSDAARSLADSTEDLTPYLRPKGEPEKAEP